MTYYLWIFLFGALVIIKAQDLELADALDDILPTRKPEQPSKAGGDDGVLPEKPNSDPKKPVAPPESGGEFSDADLFDGKDGGNPGSSQGDQYDDANNDQPKAVESGQIAGIISAVGVAVLGAASSYFAYQKKKLCFKIQGGTDPESGRNQSGTQSDPQSFSNLLRVS